MKTLFEMGFKNWIENITSKLRFLSCKNFDNIIRGPQRLQKKKKMHFMASY